MTTSHEPPTDSQPLPDIRATIQKLEQEATSLRQIADNLLRMAEYLRRLSQRLELP